jgi:hypothetical protein
LLLVSALVLDMVFLRRDLLAQLFYRLHRGLRGVPT